MTSPNIDWHAHYEQKLSKLHFRPQDLDTFYQQSKPLIDCILRFNPKRVIEAGCGLARDSFVLASKGLSVTLFDIDKILLDLARKNAEDVGVEVDTFQGDLFKFSECIKKKKYDLSFSGGVLEHFQDKEIRIIIAEQLKIVPIVIFTVPIDSDKNRIYFNDSLYRRLLSLDDWKQILSPFSAIDFQRIQSRHDDLLVVLNGVRHRIMNS